MDWNTFRLAMELYAIAHGCTSMEDIDVSAASEDMKNVLEIANKLQQHYEPGYS